MKNIVIKSFAVLLSLSLAAIAEHYFERLWVITMPSGNREIYHGLASVLSSILVLIVVAVVTYMLTIRIFKRIVSHQKVTIPLPRNATAGRNGVRLLNYSLLDRT